jgi:CopG family transcriptional regulator/antitoxin EndoAI
MPQTTQTFNISLPIELVKKADIVAKKEYRNRSELIREALRVYLQENKEWETFYEYGARQAKKMNITNEEQINQVVSDYRHGK